MTNIPPLVDTVSTLGLNISLMIALTYLLSVVSKKLPGRGFVRSLLEGLLFGLVGLFTMRFPLNLMTGAQIDARHIVVILASVFGGPLQGLVATVSVASYRLVIGGVAAGTGVVSSFVAFGLALLYRRWRKDPAEFRAWHFAFVGLLAAIEVIGVALLLMDRDVALYLIEIAAPSMLLMFPLAGLVGAWAMIRENRRLAGEVALESNRQRLRNLASANLTAHEEERRRIAHELHDDTGQVLTALAMEIGSMRTLFADANRDALECLESATRLTSDAINSIRVVTHNLRPPILETLGLVDALDDLANGFARRSGLDTRFTGRSLPDIGDDTATALYRCAQEALTNVSKHAEATNVDMSVALENKNIVLTIADNGRGFELASRTESGLGLFGMKERMVAFGGSLTVTSAPGSGTTVVASLPLVR